MECQCYYVGSRVAAQEGPLVMLSTMIGEIDTHADGTRESVALVDCRVEPRGRRLHRAAPLPLGPLQRRRHKQSQSVAVRKIDLLRVKLWCGVPCGQTERLVDHPRRLSRSRDTDIMRRKAIAMKETYCRYHSCIAVCILPSRSHARLVWQRF